MCISTAVPQHRSGGAGVPVVQVVQVFQVRRSTCVSRQRYLNIDGEVRGFRWVRWFRCFKWCVRHVYLDSGTSTSIRGCGGSGGSGGSGVSSGALDLCISTAVPQHRSGGAGVPVSQVVQVFQVVRSTCVVRQRYLNIDREVQGFRWVRWFRCFKWCTGISHR